MEFSNNVLHLKNKLINEWDKIIDWVVVVETKI